MRRRIADADMRLTALFVLVGSESRWVFGFNVGEVFTKVLEASQVLQGMLR